MEARAALRGNDIETSRVVKVMFALLAAFLLGGVGGYVIRAVGPSTPATINAPSEAVQQQRIEPVQTFAPQGVPNANQPTMPQQTLDPKGYTIQY
jgi:hypothetical protein